MLTLEGHLQPSTNTVIPFIWSMILNPYVAQPIEKEVVKNESYVTILIRCTWYAFESRSFIRAQIIIHSTYIYALIGIMHMIHGLF